MQDIRYMTPQRGHNPWVEICSVRRTVVFGFPWYMTCLLSGSWPPKQCQARISNHRVGLTANQTLGYPNNFCATIASHQISCRHVTIVDWGSYWWLLSLGPRTELSSSAYRESRLKNLPDELFSIPMLSKLSFMLLLFSFLWPNSWQEAI